MHRERTANDLDPSCATLTKHINTLSSRGGWNVNLRKYRIDAPAHPKIPREWNPACEKHPVAVPCQRSVDLGNPRDEINLDQSFSRLSRETLEITKNASPLIVRWMA